MAEQIGIAFGILCPKIKEQLLEQGYTISQEDSERFENIRKCCNVVSVHGLLTESQQKTMYQKLLKQILKSTRRKF